MVIETLNLTKQFNKKGGFKDISLSVNEGEVFGFLGKNGAGKSTFIRTLMGIIHKESGEGQLLGKPLGDISAREKIGYLPELFQYQPWISGYELLYYHGKLYKMNNAEIKVRIEEVIEEIGIKGHEHKHIKEYSKGMKQRIGLGCAIMNRPKILFLDEPTSALDPIGRRHVREIISKLRNDGTTVFLNTHLLSEVEMVADRIAIIDKGDMKKVGRLHDILYSPVIIGLQGFDLKLEEFLNNNKYKFSYKNQSLEIEEKEEQIPILIEGLVKNGAKIFSVGKKENLLEKLFLDIVGEEDSR